MKFERIKKSHKKEIIIGGMIILGIVSAITLTTSRAKYRLTQSIPIVRGTVNYKPYDFQVIAMYKQKDGSTCTEDSCYDEITDRMPSSGYAINESKSYCTLNNETDTDAKLYTNSSGEHIFKNLKKSDKCYIWFDIKAAEKAVVSNVTELIASLNPSSSRPSGTVGVFAVSDGMYGGTSYLWRGKAKNNHVIFADKCWRIIRINGDKTIRLIYNGSILSGNTCAGNSEITDNVLTGIKYNENTNNASYVGWSYTEGLQRPEDNTNATSSNAKIETEKWFTNNIIGTNLSKVADGKFCNNRNTYNGAAWSDWQTKTVDMYGFSFTFTSGYSNASLSCPDGDVYVLRAGAITADEAVMAGITGTSTTQVYLWSDKSFWTMTPMRVSKTTAYVLTTTGGFINANVNVNTSSGLRPVINLNDDITFQSGGFGTQEMPYIVSN